MQTDCNKYIWDLKQTNKKGCMNKTGKNKNKQKTKKKKKQDNGMLPLS